MDEKYPPRQIKTSPLTSLFFEPIPPGGTYKLVSYTYTQYRAAGFYSSISSVYSKGIQGFDPDTDFIVPDKPGLYYRGLSSDMEANEFNVLEMMA